MVIELFFGGILGLGEVPVDSIFLENDWVNSMESLYGRRVANYMEFFGTSLKARWKNVGDLGLINNIHLKELLLSRIVLSCIEEDHLIWCSSKISAYKVKLGYELHRSR